MLKLKFSVAEFPFSLCFLVSHVCISCLIKVTCTCSMWIFKVGMSYIMWRKHVNYFINVNIISQCVLTILVCRLTVYMQWCHLFLFLFKKKRKKKKSNSLFLMNEYIVNISLYRELFFVGSLCHIYVFHASLHHIYVFLMYSHEWSGHIALMSNPWDALESFQLLLR